MATRLLAHLDDRPLSLLDDLSELGWDDGQGDVTALDDDPNTPAVRYQGVAFVIDMVATNPGNVGAATATDWATLHDTLSEACTALDRIAAGFGDDGVNIRHQVDTARGNLAVLALHLGDAVADRARTWTSLGNEPGADDPAADLAFTEIVANTAAEAAPGDTLVATCQHRDHRHHVTVTVTEGGHWTGDTALFGRIGTYAVAGAGGTLTHIRADGATWSETDL